MIAKEVYPRLRCELRSSKMYPPQADPSTLGVSGQVGAAAADVAHLPSRLAACQLPASSADPAVMKVELEVSSLLPMHTSTGQGGTLHEQEGCVRGVLC